MQKLYSMCALYYAFRDVSGKVFNLVEPTGRFIGNIVQYRAAVFAFFKDVVNAVAYRCANYYKF